MAAKTPHLRDLFVTGRQVKIELQDVVDPDQVQTFEIWLRKPTVQQHEEASARARGRQGRRRALYRKEDSDEYVALVERMEEFDKKDALIEQLIMFDHHELRQQAYNEALYSDADEDEPRWGKEGRDYLDMLTAIRERYEEIEKFNAALPQKMRISGIKLEEGRGDASSERDG